MPFERYPEYLMVTSTHQNTLLRAMSRFKLA